MDKNSGQVTIFISYPHSARQYMLSFRKHLQGQLYGKATVWTDNSIPRGKQWEEKLLESLSRADAALVLVTPEFLASKWCRRELAHIVSMQQASTTYKGDRTTSGRKTRKNRDRQSYHQIQRIFWVQLEPSGWRDTELASLQSWDSNLKQALSEIPDVPARERAIVTICEDISDEVLALVGSALQGDLLLVRQIVLAQPAESHIVVDSVVPEAKGPFATVCRGRRAGADVAIKVIRRTPIQQLAESFQSTLLSRKRLKHQCFIKVLEHFPADWGNESYFVVVEEFVGEDNEGLGKMLARRRNLPVDRRGLPIDEVATMIRRVAEALRDFHNLTRADVPSVSRRSRRTRPPRARDNDPSYGLLMPKFLYYDKRAQKLLLPAVGVSSFLWLKLGWERFSAWQEADDNTAAYVAPEQFEPRTSPDSSGGSGGQASSALLRQWQPESTALTDQYMLGQLAFEMLDGSLPFDIRGPWEVEKKTAFWNDPRATVRGSWHDEHKAFADVIFKMLAFRPADRWTSFDEIIKRLRVMDDESRALAKRSYVDLKLEKNTAFFVDFYAEFFGKAPGARQKFEALARRRFEENAGPGAAYRRKEFEKAVLEAQYEKLRESIVAVLNFRPGNEPTSLSAIVKKHQNLGITHKHVDTFRTVFLDTLSSRLPANRRAEIREAWEELFAPVVEYFKQRLAG